MSFKQLHQTQQLPPALGPQLSVDSLSVIFASDAPGLPITLTNDNNYGTVGSNTLRTAAQIGNATGAAAFGAGASSAQTLRVMIASDALVTVQATDLDIRVLSSATDSVAAVQSGTWSVDIASAPGLATSALQTAGNASLSSIDSKLTSPLTVTGPLTDTQLRATPVAISASALPLPTGASTAANQATANASLSSIDAKLTSPLTVTGPLTDTQLRASAVPVSVASIPLPTGAATEATLSAINTKIPTGLTVTSTRLLVDGSGVTQPISAASLPLPTGAATETTLSALNTKVTTTVNGIKVDGSAVTQPVSGSVTVSGTTTANQGTANTIANAWPIKITDGTNTASVGASGNLVVSGLSAVGVAPALNPVSISGVDGGGLKRAILTGTDGTVKVDGSATTQPISAASLPLPTGAATEATLAALNTKHNADFGASSGAIRVAAQVGNSTGAAAFGAGTTSAQVMRVVLPTDQSAIPISNLPTTVSTNTGAADASTIRVAIATGSSLPTTITSGAYVTSTRTVHSVTPVTTSAWVQLVASTSATVNQLTIFSSSGSILELGVGAASSEARVLLLPPGGFDANIMLNIPSGSRISVRAVDANATAGELLINYLG